MAPGTWSGPSPGPRASSRATPWGTPILKPESTTEYEIGTDLRFLQGRAALELSYYDKRSYDQIFSGSLHALHGVLLHYPQRRGPEEQGLGGGAPGGATPSSQCSMGHADELDQEHVHGGEAGARAWYPSTWPGTPGPTSRSWPTSPTA